MRKALQLSLLLLLSVISQSLFASHLEGGEITWRVDTSGAFIFRVVLYRDCSGIPIPSSVTLTTNAPGLSNGILCNQISTKDISSTGIGCPSCGTTVLSGISTEQGIYESLPLHINGVPHSTGWYFYNNDCCRSNNITNLSNPGGQGSSVRAIMYPYNNQNTDPAFDNSPQFLVLPQLSTCTNTLTNFSEGGLDKELDSLSYAFAPAMDGVAWPLASVLYAPGYSFLTPLPGANQNSSNIAATIDPSTGIIHFKSITPGLFVVCTKVTAWKCGQKVAEVFREISINVVGNCQLVTPGYVNVPNTQPNIDLQLAGASTPFIDPTDTLLAGDSISINVSGSDFDPNSTGTNFQNIELNAFSGEFGYGDTNSLQGCSVPPCATMSDNMPLVGAGSVSSIFNWKTECVHSSLSLGCLQHQQSYLFSFRVKDDFCPVNTPNFRNLTIVVRGPDIYKIGDSLAVSYPGSSFQWYLNGAPIPNAFDSIYYPMQPGIYSVVATTNGGCQILSNTINRSSAGISQNTVESWDLKATVEKKSLLSLIIQSPTKTQGTICLFDVKGNLVTQKTLGLYANTQQIIIETGILPDGIYLVRLQTSSKVLETKVVVTN